MPPATTDTGTPAPGLYLALVAAHVTTMLITHSPTAKNAAALTKSVRRLRGA